MAIFEYIDGFYNPRRKHSAPGWKSTLACEQKVAKTSTWGGTKPRQVQFCLEDPQNPRPMSLLYARS